MHLVNISLYFFCSLEITNLITWIFCFTDTLPHPPQNTSHKNHRKTKLIRLGESHTFDTYPCRSLCRKVPMSTLVYIMQWVHSLCVLSVADKKKLAKNCYYLGHTKSHQFHKKDWVVHWHPVAPLSSSTPPRSSQSHDLGPHRRGREVAPPACWTPKPYLVGQLKTRVSWLMKHNWFHWWDGSKVDLWGSPLVLDCLPLCHPVWQRDKRKYQNKFYKYFYDIKDKQPNSATTVRKALGFYHTNNQISFILILDIIVLEKLDNWYEVFINQYLFLEN